MPAEARHWLRPFFADDLGTLQKSLDAEAARARERLRRVTTTLGEDLGVRCLPLFRWGNPAQAIVEEAQQTGAEIIVLGDVADPVSFEAGLRVGGDVSGWRAVGPAVIAFAGEAGLADPIVADDAQLGPGRQGDRLTRLSPSLIAWLIAEAITAVAAPLADPRELGV
jgi:hypothetical protein